MVDDRWPKINAERINAERRVFWPRNKETSEDVVNEKIHSALRSVKSYPLERIIIQFWRPLTTRGGAGLLSCSGIPYALSPLNHRLQKYRSFCSKYSYGIDASYVPMTIRGAPPASALLNHFPEVVMDLTLHRGTPLVDLALQCELTCFIMLPVFSNTHTLGVIEVSATHPRHLVVIFNELQRELIGLGLTFSPPYSFVKAFKVLANPSYLQLARNEIGKALQAAVLSHDITLGQVWVPYDNYNSRKGQTLVAKLDSYCVISPGDPMSSVKFFYDSLRWLPWKKWEGLIGRALGTTQPQLCKNIYRWSENKGVLAVLSANTKCTCFVICLRCCHTGNLDYVFEFFWPQSRDHLTLMEALLLTLREHLPNFKYVSGAQLGGELVVVDVETSYSGRGITFAKIFPGNQPSDTRALVGMKRKSIEGQSELTNLNNPEDNDDLIILAAYEVDYRLFFLPSSRTTYRNFMEKINQEFELSCAGTYKIEYQVLPGEWFGLTDGTSLKSCISSYRASKNIDHIKLRVLVVET